MLAEFGGFLEKIIASTWNMLNSSSPWIIFSFLVAGLLHEFLKPEKIQKTAIGSGKISGVFWTTISGMFIPICSCGTIPLGISMYYSGAYLGPTLAFMTSTPMINPIASLLLFIGLILILPDPPFVNNRYAMMLYSSTRKTWMCGMLCYMASHIILYYAFLLTVSMVFTMSHSYTGNIWSRALIRMVSVEKMAAISKYGLFVPNQSVFEYFSPQGAAISIYVLLVLCGVLLVGISCLISLRYNAVIGNLIIMLLQLLGVSVCRQYIRVIPFKMIPFCMSNLEILSIRNIPPEYAGIYFVILNIIVVFFMFAMIKRMDLHVIVSEKNE